MRVIVVGAGAAGLAATHELRKRGVEVVTLEERERVGGRISRVSEDGYIIDLGAQFMSREYEATIGLCEDIGLGDDIIKARVRIRLWNDGRLYPLGLSPSPTALWGGLNYFLKGYSARGLVDLARMMAYIARRRKDFGTSEDHHLWDLDDESFTDLALRESNEDVLENFLQPVITGLILTDPERIGAILGLVCIRMTIIGFASGLLTLRKGFGSIADRIHEKYRDSIRVSTPAKRIVIEDGAVKGVDTEQGFIDSDAVICATTATTALKLMPDLPDSLRSPLGKVRYSSCCHVVFGTRGHPFPEGEFARYLPRRSGSPIAFIGSGRAKSPDMAPPGGDLVHCFTYGRHAIELNEMTDDEAIRVVREEARKYLPALPEEPYFSRVCRFDEAVYTSPPGALSALDKVEDESRRDVKGLFLAGEYLRIGGIETAVQSGIDAADSVVREFRQA